METIITIGSKTEGNPVSSYTLRDLQRMAKAAVGKQGKVFAVAVNFDERTGNARLIASYYTDHAQTQQTYTTVAI